MDDDIEYEQWPGSCGFCNGPMPCVCPNPLTRDDQARSDEADAEARNRIDMPHVAD